MRSSSDQYIFILRQFSNYDTEFEIVGKVQFFWQCNLLNMISVKEIGAGIGDREASFRLRHFKSLSFRQSDDIGADKEMLIFFGDRLSSPSLTLFEPFLSKQMRLIWNDQRGESQSSFPFLR